MKKVYVLFLVLGLAMVLSCNVNTGTQKDNKFIYIFPISKYGFNNIPQTSSDEKTKESTSDKQLKDIPKNRDNEYVEITRDLGDWAEYGDGVKSGKESIEISNASSWGETGIISKQISEPGTYKMVAWVKADNITVGNKNYEKGKFQIVVYQDGMEVGWPDSDFRGTFDWKQKSVETRIDGSHRIAFRIGLQNASGKVFVKDIHLYKKP
jgi:hypothetical protein